jgi:Flp pilus assembly protein TadG
MMRIGRKTLRGNTIARQQQGVTALEFALIAPVLVTFLIGIMELGMIMFVTMSMDTALSVTSRQGKTGYTTTGQTVQQTITSTLNSQLGGLLDTTQLAFTTTAYGTLSQVGQAGQGTSGTGTQNQFVVYTVSYPWHLMTPMLRPFFGTNGIYTITVTTMVRNEPYGGS